MSQLATINSIIMLFCEGMSDRKLYFSDHPRVNGYAMDIISQTSTYFASSDATELFIGVAEGNFIFEGKRIIGPSVTGKQLFDLASSLHCGGFVLEKGLATAEVKNFFDITALRRIPVKKIDDARKLFKNYGINKIKIADPPQDKGRQLRSGSQKPWEGRAVKEGLLSPTIFFQEIYKVVSEAHGDAAMGNNIDIDNVKSMSEFMLHNIRTSFPDVMQHVYYPEYDSYTIGHSLRVASLAVYIGYKSGWAEKELLALGTGGLLHDIGKSKIPGAILFKKNQLTEEELRIIQAHPQDGAEILLEQQGISPLDLAACWGHHIRYDGKGYPVQPSWAIRHPITALLQICDVFEALTAIRPYRGPIAPNVAYATMLADAGAFHPSLLATFISMIGLYPPGSYVQLNDKRVGVVTGVGKKIDRPEVQITTSKDGTPIQEYDQYELDLSDSHHQAFQIQKLLLDYVA